MWQEVVPGAVEAGVFQGGGVREMHQQLSILKTDGLLACGSVEVLGNLEKVRS